MLNFWIARLSETLSVLSGPERYPDLGWRVPWLLVFAAVRSV